MWQSVTCVFWLWCTLVWPTNLGISFIPCGHAACASCTYEWFKKAHATHGKPAYRCLCCNGRVEQALIHGYTVENAVRELPRLDEKDKQLSEDSAKAAGYVDETSWDLFFFPNMMQATQTGEE